MKITDLNASDGEGHVEMQLAALGELTGGVKMMSPILKMSKNCQNIIKKLSLLLVLLLSRFILTVCFIIIMFWTEITEKLPKIHFHCCCCCCQGWY